MNWSARLHHSDLEITSKKVTRKRKTTNPWSAGCLIDCPLDHSVTWQLRMGKKQQWVFTGICLQSKATQTNFVKSGWMTIGHGHYVILSNGRIFSHSEQETNSKQVAFSFQHGDHLFMKFDKSESSFEIKKKGQSESYKFKVQDAPVGDCYMPCVYIEIPDDSVQLIDSRKVYEGKQTNQRDQVTKAI